MFSFFTGLEGDQKGIKTEKVDFAKMAHQEKWESNRHGRVRKQHPRMFCRCLTLGALVRDKDGIPFGWCFRTHPRQSRLAGNARFIWSAGRRVAAGGCRVRGKGATKNKRDGGESRGGGGGARRNGMVKAGDCAARRG